MMQISSFFKNILDIAHQIRLIYNSFKFNFLIQASLSKHSIGVCPKFIFFSEPLVDLC